MQEGQTNGYVTTSQLDDAMAALWGKLEEKISHYMRDGGRPRRKSQTGEYARYRQNTKQELITWEVLVVGPRVSRDIGKHEWLVFTAATETEAKRIASIVDKVVAGLLRYAVVSGRNTEERL